MSATKNRAELLPGRSVEYDRSGYAVRATRVYQVMRLFGQVEFDIRNIDNLPVIGSAHPVYPWLPALRILPQEDPNGIRWVVTVEYFNEVNEQSDPTQGHTIRIVSRSGDTVEVGRDIMSDQDTGAIVLNSMGQPFENTKQYQHFDSSITIVRRENKYPGTVMTHNGLVNNVSVVLSSTGLTVAPYCGRLRISWKETEEGDDLKFEYTYQILIRSNLVEGVELGWRESYIDSGYEYMDGTEIVRATEKDVWSGEERPSSKPIYLDGSGGKLDDGEPPVTITVNPYKTGSWASLYLNS